MVSFPEAQGYLTPQSHCRIWVKIKLTQAFMVFLIICKNEEDPIKNEITRVVKFTLNLIFSDAQGQLTV